MAKTKKDKPLYDANGNWVEERGRIKGAVRRAFRLSPQMKEVLQAARVELPPALKKDGKPGKRNQVRYRCAHCQELFPQKRVQVDHIETVVPLWKREAEMSYDETIRGVFCKKENLQVLCSTPMIKNGGLPSCHQKKTNEEKYIRSKLSVAKWDILTSEGQKKLMAKHKKDFVAYQAEKIEKLRLKNERKLEREKKLNERLAKLNKDTNVKRTNKAKDDA